MNSPQATPHLTNLAGATERFEDYRTVFPSCTRVVSASMATGCFPARHDLQGNSVALLEGGRLVLRDAGHPDFLQHKRRVTGRSLAMPTQQNQQLASQVQNTRNQLAIIARPSSDEDPAHNDQSSAGKR